MHSPASTISLPAISQWHVVIGGFLQDEGRPTGMVRLWRLLTAEHSNAQARVELRNWNEDWRQFAELIWRMRPDGGKCAVNVYAYSWGAGWGAMQLARQLDRRGMPIDTMVLSDPVYRSRLLSLRWLALASFSSIATPANVSEVHWYRQRRNRPCGHDLRAVDPRATFIRPPVWADCAHQYMDDLPAFHQRCLRVAREACNEGGGRGGWGRAERVAGSERSDGPERHWTGPSPRL